MNLARELDWGRTILGRDNQDRLDHSSIPISKAVFLSWEQLSSPGQILRRRLICSYCDSMTQPFDFFCKVLLIGDCEVGKTSILMRFTEATFSSSYIGTVGERVVIITDTLLILAMSRNHCL